MPVETAPLSRTSSRDAIARVPRQLAFRLDALPLAIEDGVIVVGIPDGDVTEAREALELATRLLVRTVTLPRDEIRHGLREAYGLRSSQTAIEHSPAVRMLEAIQTRAIALHASDVHLEPLTTSGRVRVRVDGMLRELETVDERLYIPLISRIKLLAGMDIADKRQPQDGRYSIERDGRTLDARVSSMPTIDGEKLVIRLLDPAAASPTLDGLGMPAALLEHYRQLIRAPYGFIIVTGPTGSGKTTTLYSSLFEIAAEQRSVCTVEDPVEMHIAGVSQVQTHSRAGLDFATVLRSFLRQDPNVIMIGEMRDHETAKIALAAALSGQLILTTLHSNDSPRTIERLLELGAQRHSIAAATSGIISQRLVRRLCSACRQSEPFPDEVRARFAGLERQTAAVGCRRCDFTGYIGRIGIFELLPITDELRDAIADGASIVTLANIGRTAGYEPLLADGLAKVAAGETTIAELERVLSCP
jgi:type IV pilus assembly protein PilB